MTLDLDALYTAQPVAVVPTAELLPGDILKLNGCLMQLGEVKQSPNHTPNEYGPCFYSVATVLKQFDGTIPASYFDGTPDARTWTVQGNSLRSWYVMHRECS